MFTLDFMLSTGYSKADSVYLNTKSSTRTFEIKMTECTLLIAETF